MERKNKKQLRAGIVGAGIISGRYIKTIQNKFPVIQIVSICSRSMASAERRAEEFGLKACSYNEMLEDETIDMIINLTPVEAHYDIIKQALLAGKHVYTEKTITTQPELARELAALAKEKKLCLGCAPDTFLGAAIQTAKKAIEDGLIGEVTSFNIAVNRNNDILLSFLPFLRNPGCGICYDFAVYHMTALVSLLGRVEKVAAIVRAPYKTHVNIMPDSPEYGQVMDTPNESEINVAVQMESKAAGTVMINADSILPDTTHFAIYGTKGILLLPDPNEFGGDVILHETSTSFTDLAKPVKLPPVNAYEEECRGIGASDLAEAVLAGRPLRASAEVAVHVLDVLNAILKSGETNEFVRIPSEA